VSKPFYDGWISQDGRLNPEAYERLPADIKPAAETFKKYGTVEDLARSHWHLTQLIGKKGLLPLPSDASEQAKTEFNARLREILKVPAKPEDYGIAKPDDIPPEAWDDAYAKNMASILHKHNAPPELVNELVAASAQSAKGQLTSVNVAQLKQRETSAKVLQETWGQEMPKKLMLARQGMKQLGLDPNDPIIGNRADVIMAAAKFTESVAEGRLIAGDESGLEGYQADSQKAQAIIFDKGNPLHEAYHNPRDPRHSFAVKTVADLNENAFRLQRMAAGAR
jgi:hypothetical protein